MLWKYILEEKVQQNWQSDCGLIVIEVNEKECSKQGGFGCYATKFDKNYGPSTLIF